MNRHDAKVLFSHVKDTWGTPPELYSRLNKIYSFSYDAACTKDDCLTDCGAYWPKQSGLTESWANERVWCNPPYGRHLIRWVEKAASERAAATLIVMLVPSRTDTAWWHLAAMTARVEFLRGRLRFKGASASAPFPSALLFWNC